MGCSGGDRTSLSSAILDGTSNTVVMSETLLGLGYDSTGPVPVDPTRQACRYPGGGMGNPGQGFTGAPGNNPNLAAAVAANTPPYWQGNRGFAWSWMKEQSTTFNTYAPPNNPVPERDEERVWLARRPQPSPRRRERGPCGRIRPVRQQHRGPRHVACPRHNCRWRGSRTILSDALSANGLDARARHPSTGQ